MDRPHNLLLPTRPTKLLPTRVVENLPLYTDIPDDTPPPGPMPAVPGYELLGLLGIGGMGVVYKARHITLKRLVALKMIAADRVRSATRRRFQTEAETVARLQHPNFVQIYEVGNHAGQPYLALELVEGGTLSDLLARRGPLPTRDAAQLVATLAHAMHYAHRRGIVHRDLKPSNVLMVNGGPVSGETLSDGTDPSPPTTDHLSLHQPKISDFGLAKLLDADPSRTSTGMIMGTPAYMAPEQAAGRAAAVGPATDVYALGAILYECLTGQPPFAGETSWGVISQTVNDDPAPPSHWRPRLAQDLDTICLTALAKEPARRYASAEDLAADLDRFAAGESIAARPEGHARKLARRMRRRPVTVAFALLVGGAALLGGLFWVGRVADAEADLARGRDLTNQLALPEAEARFDHGLSRLKYVPGTAALAAELNRERLAVQLRGLADQLQFQFDPAQLNPAERAQLAERCGQIWAVKDRVLNLGSENPDWERRVRDDLLDIGLIGVQLDAQSENGLARLDELEHLFGASPALVQERRALLRRLGRTAEANQLPAGVATTAADCHRLGRSLRHEGNLDAAAFEFDRGLQLDPAALFLHFDRARCAMDCRRYDDAIQALTACLALEPTRGLCYARRGVAYLERAKARPAGAAADREAARADFDLALKRDPALAEAWYGLGLFHVQQKDYSAAIAAIQTALDRGYSAAKGHYNLAIVQIDAGRRAEARESLTRALRADPKNMDARDLLTKLEGHK